MKINMKRTVKFATGVCAALSVVAIGSVVASSAAVKVLAAGFKAAKDTMKEQMEELKAEAAAEDARMTNEKAALLADVAEEQEVSRN